MNTIELYKLLPKKNCGECQQKLCMPFAFAVTKGEADISECPLISDQEIESIRGSLIKFDWRENLISKLKDEVSKISFPEIAEGIGAKLKDDALILQCLGREFLISSDGEITTKGHITSWVKILLLHYIKTSGKSDLSGKWVSFSELKNGMLKSLTFKIECEDPLNIIFRKSIDKSDIVLTKLGAHRQNGFPTKYAWHIYLLPKIPILILYWQDEDDFPSQTKILLDSTAESFLDVESLLFLVEGLIKNIEYGLDAIK